ncbi:MAG: hypothetical protein ACI81R_003339 [Bradymonadia bacterium]|jgi:hypothetical protein
MPCVPLWTAAPVMATRTQHRGAGALTTIPHSRNLMRSESSPVSRLKASARNAFVAAGIATLMFGCSRPSSDEHSVEHSDEHSDGPSAEGSAEPSARQDPAGAIALLDPMPIADPVLLTVDGHEITYDDVAAQIALHALSSDVPIAETVGDEWFARASVVRDFTHRAVEYALLPTNDAAEPDPALLASWNALSEEQREAYAPLDDVSVAALARTPAIRQGWVDARVAELDDDALWAAWVQATETVRLETIMVNNHAPADKVAEILREGTEIERLYRTRGGEFTLPERAEVSMIRRRVPAGEQRDDHPDREVLADLRVQLLAGASFSEVAAEHSQDASAERGGSYGIIHPNQFAGALQLEEGAITEIGTDDAGYYLLRIDRRIRPERLPLDEGLRRRIANRLARERHIAASTMRIVRAIEAAWSDGNDDAVLAIREDHDLRQNTTVPFAYPRMGSVQHVGWAPELADAIFEELLEPGDVLHRVTHRGVAVVRLVERTSADRESYTRSQEAFATTYRDFVERSAWGDYVNNMDPLNWDVDVETAASVGQRRTTTTP